MFESEFQIGNSDSRRLNRQLFFYLLHPFLLGFDKSQLSSNSLQLAELAKCLAAVFTVLEMNSNLLAVGLGQLVIEVG